MSFLPPLQSQTGNRPSLHPWKAFTLIELLTVVAIIAVLAALLFPVLGSVRKRANAAIATSNLKQTGAAIASFVAENNSTLPASGNTGTSPSYAYGLQPSVHTWVRLLAPNHQGNGSWSDPGTRLGAHLAPYLGISGPTNKEVAIPCLRDPGWLAAAKANGAATEMYWSMPTFVLRKEIRAAENPQLQETMFPFGTDGASTSNLKQSASYPRLLQELGMASKTWALIQSDKGLIEDSKQVITAGMVGANAPTKPVNDNFRLALMFDWSVQRIPVGTDLRKPLN